MRSTNCHFFLSVEYWSTTNRFYLLSKKVDLIRFTDTVYQLFAVVFMLYFYCLFMFCHCRSRYQEGRLE